MSAPRCRNSAASRAYCSAQAKTFRTLLTAMALRSRPLSIGRLKRSGTRTAISHTRNVITHTSPNPPIKAVGDISSVFPSLSGATSVPLPPRFANLKSQLIAGHEERLRASWEQLLSSLKQEIEVIKALGPAIIPELDFRDIGNLEKRTKFRDELRKRGVAVVRGVVPEDEALGWKELAQRYIQTNPSTRGWSSLLIVLFLELLCG